MPKLVIGDRHGLHLTVDVTDAEHSNLARAVAVHRDAALRATHVVVGDHDPEPRVNHMRLDSYDADGHYGRTFGSDMWDVSNLPGRP